MTPFSEKTKDKYFCEQGLTKVIGLMRWTKFAFSRSRFGLVGLRCGATSATRDPIMRRAIAMAAAHRSPPSR
jgi:hypothetical protein